MPRFDLSRETAAQLNQLLDEALELPPPERDGWLARLPDTYADLKPLLRDLLGRASALDAADFLTTLPKIGTSAGEQAPPGEPLQAGREIGTYRLIRELGRGGMGAVWLGQRTDGLVNRLVALKLPHRSWHPGLAERLVREREILAALEHPNIARLYDAGLTGDGQPFLALEFIEGRPLDAYCKDLTGRPAQVLTTKLRLFLQAARAVAYAHAKLVLHRDLKPANILVTAEGEVRLLDFGIAKLLSEGAAFETRLTEFAGRALSPEYASPEQILGEPLTVASDVYSLGVVLYELLTATRPYRPTRPTRGALEDAILHAEPERPSAVAEAAQRSLLRGDLDTIVLHALRKNPAERYATLHAFSEDVERFLDGRPVRARPDAFTYRARKFVGRHKWRVAAAALIVFVMLVGSGVALWQAGVARAQAHRAVAVKDFIASIFRDASPDTNGGKPVSAVELLTQAEQRIAQIPANEPEVRVELQTIVGDSLLDLQDNEPATRVLAAATAEGTRTLGPLNPTVVHARVRLAVARAFLGQYETAQTELAATMLAMEGAGLTNTEEYVDALLQRAAFAIDAARYDEAEHYALAAAASARRVLGPVSQPLEGAMQLLGTVYKNQNRPDLSARYSTEAYRMALQVHAGNARHPDVIDAQVGYAEALQLVGDLPGAAAQLTGAVTSAEQVFGADGMMVGFFLRRLAEVECDLGELDESIRHGERSLQILEAHASPPAVAHANRLMTLGRSFLQARRTESARAALARALEIRRTLDDPARQWAVEAALASAQRLSGDLPGAESALSEIPLDAPGLATEDRMRVLRELGLMRARQGRHDEAAASFARALEGPGPRTEVELERAETLSEIGAERLAAGDLEGASAALESALHIFADRQRRATPARADALGRLARVRIAQHRLPDARQLLEEANAFWHGFDPQSPWALDTARLLAGSRAD